MKNKIILGIDTSTDNCSVALLKNNEIIGKRSEIAKSAHSEKLIAFIHEILGETKISIKDLDAIGVNIGPGSFTGLRIGLSMAKGLTFPYDIPIYPIKSIPTLILSNEQKENTFYFIKSHKNMIFYHNYREKNQNILDVKIEYGDMAEIINNQKDINIVGNFDFVEISEKNNKVIYPTGQSVARLVYENFDKLKQNSDNDIEPYYLTSFQTQKWSGNKKK